jgi:hypothetical protein
MLARHFETRSADNVATGARAKDRGFGHPFY